MRAQSQGHMKRIQVSEYKYKFTAHPLIVPPSRHFRLAYIQRPRDNTTQKSIRMYIHRTQSSVFTFVSYSVGRKQGFSDPFLDLIVPPLQFLVTDSPPRHATSPPPESRPNLQKEGLKLVSEKARKRPSAVSVGLSVASRPPPVSRFQP